MGYFVVLYYHGLEAIGSFINLLFALFNLRYRLDLGHSFLIRHTTRQQRKVENGSNVRRIQLRGQAAELSDRAHGGLLDG